MILLRAKSGLAARLLNLAKPESKKGISKMPCPSPHFWKRRKNLPVMRQNRNKNSTN